MRPLFEMTLRERERGREGGREEGREGGREMGMRHVTHECVMSHMNTSCCL